MIDNFGAEFEWYENPSRRRDIILDQLGMLEPSGDTRLSIF